MTAPVNRIGRRLLANRLRKRAASSQFSVVSQAVINALGGLNPGQRMLLERAYRMAQETASRPNRWRVEQWCGLN